MILPRITEDEVHEAVRKATIDLSIVPMMCGSSFKIKEYKPLLMQFAVTCLHLWISMIPWELILKQERSYP